MKASLIQHLLNTYSVPSGPENESKLLSGSQQEKDLEQPPEGLLQFRD